MLLVDDHDDTCNIFRRVLKSSGYVVHIAGAAAQAHRVAAAEHPSLLLCDVRLPDGDGCDVLSGLRALYPWMTAIAITGSVSPEEEARCRAAGFGWFLRKPVEIEQLLSVVKTAYLHLDGDSSAVPAHATPPPAGSVPT